MGHPRFVVAHTKPLLLAGKGAPPAWDFVFDQAGRVVTQLNPGWARSDLYAGAWHVATYTNSSTYFDHTDWLGTVRARTDPTGASAEACTSLPFGDAQNCSGYDWNLLHYTGQTLDTESNLTHTLFRQLSTTQGRWTVPDPAGLAAADPANPQNWNRYAYVMNTPLSVIDPKGRKTKTIEPQYHTFPPCAIEDCIGEGGYTIFDAIAGEPGTYLTTNMYGQLGFGFSEDLWIQTQNYLDQEFAKLEASGQSFNPNPILTVNMQDFGLYSSTTGLVPEWLQLQAGQNWLFMQLPENAAMYVDKGIRNGYSPAALFNYALQQWAPNMIPYAEALANDANSYENDFCNVFGLPGCNP
jgi:RHS repeat-associated protein